MLKQVLSAIKYILFFALMVFLTLFYKHPLFIFVLMLLLVLPPVSYFACRYCFFSLTPFLEAKPSISHAQSTVTLSIGLINKSIFPIADLSVTYHLDSSFYPCKQKRIINCPIYGKKSFSFDIPVHFERSGCYIIVLEEIHCYDYLHIFTFRRSLSQKREITIYPKEIDSITFPSATYAEGFDEFEESSAKGNVSSNVTDVREYIPGDRLQKIHFKLSARIQKLMVKENEATSTNQFTLLVELYQPVPESDILEQSLTNCCAMAHALIRAQEVFYFTFYCMKRREFSSFLIHCEEDFERALSACFCQSTYTQKNLALETQQKAQIIKGVILHATHEGVTDVSI